MELCVFHHLGLYIHCHNTIPEDSRMLSIEAVSKVLVFWFLPYSHVHGSDRCMRHTCRRQQFTEYRGYAYNGTYIVYKGPWPYHVCERLCRQYLECTTFVMKWTGTGEHFGYCGLIKYTPNKELLITSDDHTIYGK